MMRWAYVAPLLCLLVEGRAAAQVTNSYCVATGNSSVDCRGVTFTVDLSAPGVKTFMVSYLNGVVARLQKENTQSLEGALEAIQGRWQQDVLAPLLHRVEVLERADEKTAGVLDQLSSDHDQDRKILAATLDALLGLQSETSELRRRLAELDTRVKALENKSFLVDQHRLRPQVSLVFEPGGPEDRKWLAAGADYRMPGRFVLALGFSYLHLLSMQTSAGITQGAPDHLQLGTVDNVDANGHALELSLLLGWEIGPFTPYLGVAPRFVSLTYKAAGAPRVEWDGWEWPLLAGSELRIFGGVSVFGTLGCVFSPSHWSREYEYALSGQELVASRATSSTKALSVQGGVRIAVGL